MDFRKPGTVEIVYDVPAGTPDHRDLYVSGGTAMVRPGPQMAVRIYPGGRWKVIYQYARVRKDGTTSKTVGESDFSSDMASAEHPPAYVTDAVERASKVAAFAFPGLGANPPREG